MKVQSWSLKLCLIGHATIIGLFIFDTQVDLDANDLQGQAKCTQSLIAFWQLKIYDIMHFLTFTTSPSIKSFNHSYCFMVPCFSLLGFFACSADDNKMPLLQFRYQLSLLEASVAHKCVTNEQPTLQWSCPKVPVGSSLSHISNRDPKNQLELDPRWMEALKLLCFSAKEVMLLQEKRDHISHWSAQRESEICVINIMFSVAL